ncbi:uncharacterized protein LOC112556614 isoform X4 [Pomacea canaliculata]|uniref:uncharacterized protein LOC112556614 isoform X4 n=1 Tax=Pomacea canaliculata TaxID=400727 RepID=UPI000D731C6B|nr:uncharacterized protein LOC112556614 isoform X4 [Pomacea canaliculata]
MASSLDSPENARQRRAWALWQELLPGIEEFLVRILPQEKLSRGAEERRQYFVERLDILKLPPSLPPRAGKRISREVHQESERVNGQPAEDVTQISQLVENDFAAYQREISRNLLVAAVAETNRDATESELEKGVKVYDDIEPTESTKNEDSNDDDDDDISALYEIPVARQQLPPLTSEDSLSQPADISSLANATSTDDVSDDVLDASSPVGHPPPLPPRKDPKVSESGSRSSVSTMEDKPPDLPLRHPALEKKVSESGSRSSVNNSDDKPPELPFRPPQLSRRSEISQRSKSDVSDGDSTSYESFDEDHDAGRKSKSNIKLPMRPKKKIKKGSKHPANKTRSSATWEINVPFKKLDNILLSGELLHKGKLSWNRRVVAISNGSMALYKPEKEARPVFVIPLAGYQASVGDKDGRKGFEITMVHSNGDSHLFTVDFKEWATIWCEYVNNLSKGLSVIPFHQHLARTFSGESENSISGSRIQFDLGDYEAYEEYDNNSNNDSKASDTPPPTPQTPRSKLASQRSWRRALLRKVSSAPPSQSSAGFEPPAPAGSASNLSLARWDWKTIFYHWSFPLDEVIVGIRRVSVSLKGNLSATSNSNLSINSNGSESDDSTKPRLRGNKVMRMGSFAYRATQFFENLGKKATTKRKTNSLSSPLEGDKSFRDGIQEESSMSSTSLGVPASPLSENFSPGWQDGHQTHFSSSPVSSEHTLPSPLPVPDIPLNVKVQGHLNIFSSFNKRRWGLRWCLVRENMFECYLSQTSQHIELNFLLRKCIIRHAVAETKSPLALMLLEHDKEKITVEPQSKEEMSQWLTVLMMETSTEAIPSGLEEYFRESEDPSTEEQLIEPDYTDIPAVSFMLQSASHYSPPLPKQQKDTDITDVSGCLTSVDEDTNILAEKQVSTDVYTEVIKRPSSTRLADEGKEDKQKKMRKDKKEARHPRFMDNLAVCNMHRNTTDSGFYSVKDNNSDSDSGCEYTHNTQRKCSSLDKEDLSMCSNVGKETSDSDIASSSHRTSEEEDDESVLERTMTAEDFTDNLVSAENICESKVEVTSSVSDGNDCGSCKIDETSGAGVGSGHRDMPFESSEKDAIPQTNFTDSQQVCDDSIVEKQKPRKSKKSSHPKQSEEEPEVAVTNGDGVQDTNHVPSSSFEATVLQKSDLSSCRSDTSDLGKSGFVEQSCTGVDTENERGVGCVGNVNLSRDLFTNDNKSLCGNLITGQSLRKKSTGRCGSLPQNAKNCKQIDKQELHETVLDDELLDSWGLSSVLSKGLWHDDLQGNLSPDYECSWQRSVISDDLQGNLSPDYECSWQRSVTSDGVPRCLDSSFPIKVQLRTVSDADSNTHCCHDDTNKVFIPTTKSVNTEGATASRISSFGKGPLASPAKDIRTEDSNQVQLVADLKDRISQLKEKLTQIKRKREAWDEEFADFYTKFNDKQAENKDLELPCETNG